MPTVRTCRICGEPTEPRRVYCDPCLQHPAVYRACRFCDRAFNCAYVSRGGVRLRKYCSDECQRSGIGRALQAQKLDPAKPAARKTCNVCGEEFAAYIRAKKGGWRERQFCSNSCAQSNRARSQETRYACRDCGAKVTVQGPAPSAAYCPGCRAKRATTRECTDCGHRYPSRSKRAKVRCPECLAAFRAARLSRVTCVDCGVIELADHHRLRCRRCKNRRAGKGKHRRHRKRRAYIIERDKGRCQACKRKVKTHDPLHPRAAEIDHIIPRSLWPTGKPGLDHPSNLRLLCRTCNSQKSNGQCPGGDQLMLLG